MTVSAVLMMILGLAVTWGGAGVCIYIAVKKREF
ncbi:MAG: MetS family NSS transporter small subunit [Syntrophobacteria bacterium]